MPGMLPMPDRKKYKCGMYEHNTYVLKEFEWEHSIKQETCRDYSNNKITKIAMVSTLHQSMQQLLPRECTHIDNGNVFYCMHC